MKPTKPKSRGANAGRKGSKRFACVEIVLLDQGPLRSRTASDCSREMARVEKAKADWKRYQTEDRASFERWMAATFGSQLSRLRELDATVQSLEALIDAVDFEMNYNGARSYRAAYARVQERRDAPPPEPSQEEAGQPDFEEIPEFEQELIFQEFLRDALGMNPDRMGDRQYEKMFSQFKAKAFPKHEPEPPPQPPPAPPKPEQSRIKEIYRLLVRRLHPDTRAESDAEVSALWHDVQEAYGSGNVERLEMLLALTEMQSSETSEQTTLFQMRGVLKELRRAFNAIQRNLKAAKADPAWNFSQLINRAPLEKRVRRDLESRLSDREGRVRSYEALVASWSPRAKKRS